MTTSLPDATSPDPVVLDARRRRLDPRARTAWVLFRCFPWAVLGCIGLVFAVVDGEAVGVLWVLGFTGILVGIAAASAVLSYRYWSWTPHADALEISRGVISRHVSVVPYHRIQQIDIDRDPVERMLGIATLVLRSAAATTDARIPGIALADTEPLRHALLERAGSGDAV